MPVWISQVSGERMRDRLDARGLDSTTWASSIMVPALTIIVAGDRVIDVVKRGAAQNTLTDGRHDLTGIDDRRHGQALVGAAIDWVTMQSWATSTRRRVR
jgi:hypothetical protein